MGEATEFVVTINPDLLEFGFDGDENDAEAFAARLRATVHECIPWAQFALGAFAVAVQRPITTTSTEEANRG